MAQLEQHLGEPVLRAELALAEPVAARADLALLQREVQQELAAVQQGLGLPGRWDVVVTSSTELARAPFALTINGERCWFSLELQQRVSSLVLDVPLDALAVDAQVWTESQLHQFLRLMCSQIVKERPTVLLTADVVTAYRNALRAEVVAEALPSETVLREMLSAALSLWLSVVDAKTVARVWQESAHANDSVAAAQELLIAALRPGEIEVHLSEAYLREMTSQSSSEEQGIFGLLREGLFYELGLQFPDVRFVLTDELPAHWFRFRLNHLTTLPWRGLAAGECLLNDAADRLRVLGIESRPALNPANRNAVSVATQEAKPVAEQAGVISWSPLGYLILALSGELRAHAAGFVDANLVTVMLDKLQQVAPQLTDAARQRISAPLLTQTLRTLVSEDIAIRDLRAILQAMLEFDYIEANETQQLIFDPRLAVSHVPGDAWLSDPVPRASHVREQLKRYLSHKYTRGQSTLIVYLLDWQIENLLQNEHLVRTDEFLAQLAPETKAQILEAVRAEVSNLPVTASVPVVLTTTAVRPLLRAIIAPEFPALSVLSYRELVAYMNIQPIARIALTQMP